MRRMIRSVLLTGFIGHAAAQAQFPAAPPLHTLTIQASSNVASGRALHLAVDRPELQGLSASGAVRMAQTSGSQWQVRIAVQGDVTSTGVLHRFTSRSTNSTAFCNPSDGILAGPDYSAAVPLWTPDYDGKTMYYRSAWTNVQVLYRVHGTDDWALSPPMIDVGPGRQGAERKYRISGIGTPGRPLEFVLRGWLNGVELWDNPAVGGVNNNYWTPLDFFFLQDKNIFNYDPPATVSAPQVISVANWPSSFTGNGIPSRGGRIYLPRGYTQNTTRRYPVLYMHDGQNVLDPGGAFGSWSADAAATAEIAQGRMRETIIVAVNNSGNRFDEYCPPGDRSGTGNFYLRYIVENIMPGINSSYRTLTNVTDTGVMGSSLGGLISAYFGLSTNRFGLVGAVSPSYWYAPNFRTWLGANPVGGRRIYQDAGSSEGASMWDHFWPVYDAYLADGYVINGDFKIAIGCGDEHNEAAWARRVGGAFQFLFNPWDEVNLLATSAVPPVISLAITNPPGPLAVAEDVATINVQGVADPAQWTTIHWTNALRGHHGFVPATASWTITGIPLAHGENTLSVQATNQVPVFQQQASDAASSSAYAGGWTNGSNGGYGFGPWSLNADAGGNAGSFIGAHGWGLWAQSGNLSEAVRPISLPLGVGQRLRVTLKNGDVSSSPSQSVGFALRSSDGNSRIQFYFIGGDAAYIVEDAIGGRSSGIGWTDQPQTLEIEVVSATSYVARVGGVAISGVYEGKLDQVRAWNWNGGVGPAYDFFVNDVRVFSVGMVTTGAAASVVVTRAAPAVHDGIPVSWWNRYGLGTSTTAAADLDGDGLSNFEEFVFDTHPLDFFSAYPNRVSIPGGPGPVMALMAGPPTTNSRRYGVWFQADPIAGTWDSLPVTEKPGADDGGPVMLLVTNTAPVGFYRTGVRVPPE